MFNKDVLVIGAAITGIDAVIELCNMGNRVILNDSKDLNKLGEEISKLEGLDVEIITGGHPVHLAEKADCIIISPGVPTDIPLIKEAKRLGKEVISEIELAYRITKTPIAAITGTNGKTTTTVLLGEMMKESKRKTYIRGNIGEPMIKGIREVMPEDIFVLEVSSFQLESTRFFKPYISAILNISPDHLNRHKTMDNYINEKCKIFSNQGDTDFTILNYDNELTAKLFDKPKSRTLMFSRKTKLVEGAFIEDGIMTISINGKKDRIINIEEIYIPGNHNVENALAASLMAYCLGVNVETIKRVLKEFKGVEHRIEYICEIDGVDYYNDSKGTNPDSSIKAIEAMSRPIVLIAGGMDKGSSFEEFIKSFHGRVKELVLLGETADKIEAVARKQKFMNIYKTKDLEEAVYKAKKLATSGDVILLSPACASWDMFKNFEERGALYKSIVIGIKGAN